ncbi:hypothetical protein POM88_018679 [Heracleum sosnowskyi]|uniref:Uncharacterized protein n=1 Tax=Heracleum sosnowskyi TaxID=360622 RepID=A0AAD8IRW5_9APIA|nr:hypothetical protein POM88_018679 [Heracleum sosnowskyi]
MHNAEIDHQGHAMEHMHEYSPWWCSADIWAEMCVKWRDENWQKKRKIASTNRAGGGEKAKESQSQGTPIHWLDVYVETRDGLPYAVNIAGQGQKWRPSIGGFSGSTQSLQSSSQPFVHTPADCVRAICQNRELLLELGGHLGAMDPEDLARAVAAAAASQQQDGDGDEGSHHDDRDDEFGGSS